jgi:hypothetical protein
LQRNYYLPQWHEKRAGPYLWIESTLLMIRNT